MPKADGLTYRQRFWTYVNKRGPWAVINGKRSRCWLWTGGVNSDGYGGFWIYGKHRKHGTRRAHKVAYEWANGPVPDGLTLDHLCKKKRCIRPLHQEPVTDKVNILRSDTVPSAVNARKTHCPSGHAYDDVNSVGARICTVCQRQYHRDYKRRSA